MQQQNEPRGLNYYSRYHRIKHPREIDSLLHLISGLNLDSLLSDDLMLTIAHLHDLNQHPNGRSLNKRGAMLSGRLNRTMGDRSVGRKHRSIDNQAGEGEARVNFIEGYLKDQGSSRKTTSKRGIHVDNNEQAVQEAQNKPQSRSANRSKPKTNTLTEMNCQQAESIPNSQKSPLAHVQQNTNQKQQPQQSRMDDQFSEDIAQLNRVDQIRNSSYHCAEPHLAGQDHEYIDEGTKSEALERMRFSDIFVEDTVQPEQQQKQMPDGAAAVKQVKMEQNYAQRIELVTDSCDIKIEHCESYYQSEMQQHNIQQQDIQDQTPEQSQLGNQVRLQQEVLKAIQITSKDLIPTTEGQAQDNHTKEAVVRKLPSRALTEGKYPQQTQKSIFTPEVHLPSTLVLKNPAASNNSNISEKQRKPFKKMMMDKKLNPRMVISTILQETPVKKLNFKKVIKKQSMENRQKVDPSQQSRKLKDQKSTEHSRKLLQAFFNQN